MAGISVRAAETLPTELAGIVGWAVNDQQTVRVTVDSHGALSNLEFAGEALRLGPNQRCKEIVRLTAQAHRAAMVESVGKLAFPLGDAATLRLAEEMGLGDMIEPDAPVIPLQEGARGDISGIATPQDDDDIHSFDFSQFRSDR
ncbi:MAG: hypothetical protein ACRDRN_13965 [Sciscionella sp.]